MQELFLALPVLLFSMVVHEYAHGYAALRQGDDTAQKLGRLTFNPIRHIDPWLTIMMPALLLFLSGGQFVFGGAKPVPVDRSRFRHPRSGDLIVSSAGIISNLALFVICLGLMVVTGVVGGGSGLAVDLQRMIYWGMWLNLLLAFFNLIPVPPLDGSHILYNLLPARAALAFRKLTGLGILMLLAILMVPGLLDFFLYPARAILRWGLDLTRPFHLGAVP